MDGLFSQPYFWVLILLHLFVSANINTKEWIIQEFPFNQYNYLFETPLYSTIGWIGSIVCLIASILISCSSEWWYFIIIFLTFSITGAIILDTFKGFGVRYYINIISVVAIPILSILFFCLM